MAGFFMTFQFLFQGGFVRHHLWLQQQLVFTAHLNNAQLAEIVLEAKQSGLNMETGGWDRAMLRAHNQADQYVRALPSDEGRPPFIIVTDVGRSIELYAEFCRKFIITYHNPVIIPELRTAGNMIIPFVQKRPTQRIIQENTPAIKFSQPAIMELSTVEKFKNYFSRQVRIKKITFSRMLLTK